MKPYVAHIHRDGKFTHLGYFSTEKEAGDAYFAAALDIFGEFARAK